MSTSLLDRLEAARRQRFVGRTAERALFQSALTTVEAPFSVLYLFGAGGVGKTTLLPRIRPPGHPTGRAHRATRRAQH